MTFLTFP
jgi:phosphatidylglycerophosphatase GEP4